MNISINFIYYGTPFDASDKTPGKSEGKFVQIRTGNTEYLVFSTKEISPYHADIVERFCREKGIPGSYNGQGKKFIIHDPQWVVCGGGKFEINAAEKYVRLYDNSMAYGRFVSEGLKEKILTMKNFHGYDLRTD